MVELQKTIDTANNSTKLAAKTKGYVIRLPDPHSLTYIVTSNSTKEAEYKAKATKAQTKLDAMTSNTTLVDACTALTSAKEDGTTTSSVKASSSSSSGSTSAGLILNAKAGSVFSAMVLVAVGTMML